MNIINIYTNALGNDVIVYEDGTTETFDSEGSVVAAEATTIIGTDDADKLHGTSADDIILGMGGDDKITGGGGDDIIDGGSGSDIVLAGGGADLLIWNFEEHKDTLDGLDYYNAGGVNGAQGNDTLQLTFTSVQLIALGQSLGLPLAPDPTVVQLIAFIEDVKASIEAFFTTNNTSNQTVDFRDLDASLTLYAKNFEFINIVTLNSAPISIALDNLSINENAAGGVIGALTVTDLDAGDSHSLSVDDARFEVNALGELKLKAGESLDHEAESSVIVIVTATDLGGLSVAQAFVITVNDIVGEDVVGSDGDDVIHGFLIMDSAFSWHDDSYRG